jgi:ribokinase
VKVNLEEAASAGVCHSSAPSLNEAVQGLLDAGARGAVVTDGAHGAVGGTPQGYWRVRSPAVTPLATVGAGDAFTAGLLVALSTGLPMPDALVEAAATGAASTLCLGAGALRIADRDPLRERATAEPLGL